jgi:hypothetical protein
MENGMGEHVECWGDFELRGQNLDDKICFTTIKEDEVINAVLDLVIMVKQGFSINWGIMVCHMD